MATFKIKAKHKKARSGVLQTEHGKVLTPNLATVATHGEIRFFSEADHKSAKPELIISNTFHLWVNNKVKEIKKAGGLHQWNKLNVPSMTDSGGFQVFSLGWGQVHQIGKIAKGEKTIASKNFKNPVKITDEGAVFTYEGKTFNLTPEESMKVQKDIGADIIFAFDEPTSPYHSKAYSKKALKRTHDWARRSFEAHKKIKSNQMLMGIVQGGAYEDLRRQSSKFIGSLPFGGFGIGGAFGEKEMGEAIGWSLSGLPEEKPRHLLGVGKVRDIFIGVEQGIDLFDCVIPTREGRHGMVYTEEGRVDIKKTNLAKLYKKDKTKAQKMAVIRNIRFFKNLFKEIRNEVESGKGLGVLKKKYKNYLK